MTSAYTILKAGKMPPSPVPPHRLSPQTMVDHAVFIWTAYAVALVGLGGLVVASLVARRRVRRALGARGLERRR